MQPRTAMILGAALCGLFAPAGAIAQEADNETLVMGATRFLTNFHPMIQVNIAKRNLTVLSLRPITAYDTDGNNTCVLCEELPTLENGLAQIVDRADGSKGMTVRVTLKEGLAWGDGTPVTTEDVVFTHEVASDPSVGLSNFYPWTRAERIEAVDDRTFVAHLPALDTTYTTWDQILPAHLERSVYEANRDTEAFARASLYNREPTNPGLWNGSYILDEYEVGTRLVFKPNPHWPGQTPDIENIVFSYRENSPALLQAMLAGEIDMVPVNPVSLGLPDLIELRSRHPGRFNYFITTSTGFEALIPNLDNELLSDVRVRRALLLGIDRETINATLFEGEQPPVNSIISIGHPFHDPDTAAYDYDPSAAKALLAEAGWTPGPDGICMNGEGDRLSLELGASASNTTREQVTLVLQDQLKDICVELTPRFIPLQEFRSEYVSKRQFPALMLNSMNPSLGSSPGRFVGSGSVPSATNEFVGDNYAGYSSPAMDKAVAELDSAMEQTRIREKWSEVQRIFAEDLPFIPLYANAIAWIAPSNMGGLEKSPYEIETIWAETWTLN